MLLLNRTVWLLSVWQTIQVTAALAIRVTAQVCSFDSARQRDGFAFTLEGDDDASAAEAETRYLNVEIAAS